jgi:hypothetical protein
MTESSEEMPTAAPPDLAQTIEEAAEKEAKKISKSVQNKPYEVKIYAYLSGEHNPIHGYKVVLSPGSP